MSSAISPSPALGALPSSLGEALRGELTAERLKLYNDLAVKLVGVLSGRYQATFVIPRNVIVPGEFALYLWPDLIGERLVGLTLFAWFPFSIFRRDRKSELEPLELVFFRLDDGFKLIGAYGRVHYDLCEYNLTSVDRLTIMYFFHGHTPFIDGVGYVRVRCPALRSSQRRLGRKYWDRIWLASAKIFLKATKPQRFSLRELESLGAVRVLELVNGSSKNPFRAPLRPVRRP